MNHERRKPGRPPSPTGTMEPLRVTIAPEDMTRLDAYCEQNRIGRSEAIRQAIRLLTRDEEHHDE